MKKKKQQLGVLGLEPRESSFDIDLTSKSRPGVSTKSPKRELTAQGALRTPNKNGLSFSCQNKLLDLPTFPPHSKVGMKYSQHVRCIDLVFTQGITELLEVLPRDSDFWRETDEAGSVQLKRTIFVTEDDLNLYDNFRKCRLYEKIHRNFLMHVTENGEIL